MEKINKIKELILKYKYQICFIVILFLAIFARGYALDKIPYGIHVDECGMAYDAFCIATNGTDRYLNSFPVYPTNFGGGMSALCTYLAAIFVKIMGLSILSIRIPTFLLYVISVVVAYFIARKEKGEKFALVFMGLVTICPWHIMSSRFGLDCNLLAPMMIISSYLLLRAQNKKEYVLAGISFGLTLYTYALSYMILPIFLLLILCYMLYTKKIKFWDIVILGVPIAILAIPLMLMILVNNGIVPEINSFISINKLPGYRGTEVSLSSVIKNLKYFKQFVTHDDLTYNATTEFGAVYNYSIVLIIAGLIIEIYRLIKSLKNKEFELGSFMLIEAISVAFVMLLIFEPNINKANALYIPMMYFAASAIREIYKKYKVVAILILILFIVSFVRFEYFYFKLYNAVYGNQYLFENEYLDELRYISNLENLKDKNIYLISENAEPYIYTLFVDQTDPNYFMENLHEETFDDDLWSYGRYYVRTKAIEEDAVYIVNTTQNQYFVDELISNGYTVDNNTVGGNYVSLYK